MGGCDRSGHRPLGGTIDAKGTTMNGAQLLLKMLEAYAVEYVFGVPGDTSLPLYEALYDQRAKVRHVMARDERSASVMADAYARFSGKPGVCECPSGAGAIFSMAGVAEAFDATRPLILITSDTPLSGEGRNLITELDVKRLFEPVTKASWLLKQVDKIPETVRRAFRIATTGAPGAVHLAVPTEVMTGEFSGDPEWIKAEPGCRRYPALPFSAPASLIRSLADLLAKARRPAVISGGGAVQTGAGPELLSLVERLNCPLLNTMSGQGILPHDHPLSFGVIGDNGYHPHALKALTEADLLVYIGCKMGSVSTINWTCPPSPDDPRIVQIDVDPKQLSNTYHNLLDVIGDAATVLRELNQLLADAGMDRPRSGWVRGLDAERAAFWQASDNLLTSDTVPLKGARVISALNRRLNAKTLVISDAGTPTPYVTRFLRLTHPDSDIHIPRSYGGLGYAIPALVGAHCAHPEAKLVGLFGDGSLGMSAGELETIARLSLPAVIVHFNNASFGWIKALQKIRSGGRYFSVDFKAGDPALVAEGFGLTALRAETATELEMALDRAFQADGPVFVDVKSESPHIDMPPVYCWEKMTGKNGHSIADDTGNADQACKDAP